ncbi:hypothetical protein E2C01_096869 [Portunus trituberculatus]|uniref:Uncharacterized protein n=1 Tax=Portunus trituberculatus TaxID=210409 RepID=A0A5B7K482_PORTR|nr:hypothetical protein [Portunus trituberculatus]
MVNGIEKIDKQDLVLVTEAGRTRGHAKKISKRQCMKDIGKYSFPHRMTQAQCAYSSLTPKDKTEQVSEPSIKASCDLDERFLLCLTTQGGSHSLPSKENSPSSHKASCTYHTYILHSKPSLGVPFWGGDQKCPQFGLLS